MNIIARIVTVLLKLESHFLNRIHNQNVLIVRVSILRERFRCAMPIPMAGLFPPANPVAAAAAADLALPVISNS